MYTSAVPRSPQVVPGACVNIVLKADQRTGRQVAGFVSVVLTRGDHPRGIKVRLADGRVGRVQGMADSAKVQATTTGSAAEDHSATLARDLQTQQQTRRGGHKYRDIREEEHLEAPPEQVDLSAYIVPARAKAKGKGKGNKGGSAPTQDAEPSTQPEPQNDVVSANVTCPVCNSFQGDEAAVAHHVAGHFE